MNHMSLNEIDAVLKDQTSRWLDIASGRESFG
jgi:hypothetical protein